MPVQFNKLFIETPYKTDITTPNVHNDRDLACVAIVIATGKKDNKIVTKLIFFSNLIKPDIIN